MPDEPINQLPGSFLYLLDKCSLAVIVCSGNMNELTISGRQQKKRPEFPEAYKLGKIIFGLNYFYRQRCP